MIGYKKITIKKTHIYSVSENLHNGHYFFCLIQSRRQSLWKICYLEHGNILTIWLFYISLKQIEHYLSLLSSWL